MIDRFFPNHLLTPAERALIPEVIFQLFLARLQVTFLPSKKYLPQSNKTASQATSNPPDKLVPLIAAVVNGVALRTPWRSTCLVKVLATHRLLLKQNIPHFIYMGIKKQTAQLMEAHAWLSVSDKIIVGGEIASEFTVIRKIQC